jgi:alkylation response protein AidB-like acyl-CoA dehydrogenase
MVRPDGKAWERTFMFRREKARIDDVWQVMGLRGTGSDNYTIDGLFVDDAHNLTREYDPERRQLGPLYSFQAMQLYASGFASVAPGISRVMLDAFIGLARSKTQAWSSDPLRDNQAVQQIVSCSDAAWKAARAGLHKAVDDAWQDVLLTGVLTLDHRMEIRQAATYAIHVSRVTRHGA